MNCVRICLEEFSVSENVVVSTFVRIDRECPIEYRVIGGEAEFSIGGWINAFEMVATEEGLACLVSATIQALAKLRELRADA